MHRSLIPLALAAQATVVCAAGCEGSGEGLTGSGRPIPADAAIPDANDGGDDAGAVDAASAATLSAIQTEIFTPTCATEECHVVGIAPHGLILQAGLSHGLLVNAAADEDPAMTRVIPGDPNDSYLLIKLLPDDPRNRDKRMPRDGPPFLTDQQIEMVRSWIQAGALDD